MTNDTTTTANLPRLHDGRYLPPAEGETWGTWTNPDGKTVKALIGAVCYLAESCYLAERCSLGAWCYLGAGCRLAEGCYLGAECILGAWCILGAGCSLGERCILGAGCILGERCRIGAWGMLGERCSLGAGCRPISLPRLRWEVTIYHDWAEIHGSNGAVIVQIGCQIRPLDEWLKMTPASAGRIHSDGAAFLAAHLPAIESLSKSPTLPGTKPKQAEAGR